MAHVVVDARMARHSGIGTYIRNVVPRVARLEPAWRFTVIAAAGDAPDEPWRLPNVQRVPARAAIYGIREQLELPWCVPRGADLFWAPHYNVPVSLRLPMVVTIHDLGHLRLREHTRSPLRQAYARGMFHIVARRARAVICVSRFTRDELRAAVGLPRGVRAVVVHGGVDDSWFVPASGGERMPRGAPYFVFVGNLKPHKNLGCVLEALRLAGEAWPATLVVIGRSEGLRTRDDDALRAAGRHGARVEYVGEVDDATLRRYVTGAAALVFPSTYEGFGLPPLEAMAAGTPVIAARAASIPEVCGDAALYFDPANPSDLMLAMRRVLKEPGLRGDLSRRGLARAREFSWETTARATRDVLREALDAHTH